MNQVRLAALLTVLFAASPVLADEALDQGKADFAKLCAPCHGVDAKGDGPEAAKLPKKPVDLTRITQRYGKFPEDRVFATIAGLDMPEGHGTREMPIWGDVFVSESVGNSTSLDDALRASDEASRRIAGLMHYLETIQETP